MLVNNLQSVLPSPLSRERLFARRQKGEAGKRLLVDAGSGVMWGGLVLWC
jgi:hypothetical protein